MGESFVPDLQFEKREIHTVFLHFSNFRLKQKLLPSAPNDLIRGSLETGNSIVGSKKVVFQRETAGLPVGKRQKEVCSAAKDQKLFEDKHQQLGIGIDRSLPVILMRYTALPPHL